MMNFGEYQISHYSPEYKEQVLNVLEHLWPYEREKFADYFEWKYEQNPSAENVLGSIALYKGKAVGFRGYFANRYVINDSNNIFNFLIPGDTCVQPEHRIKGLSVEMGNLAFKYYNKQYHLFMNTTCNRKSFPGYLKMGYYPLEPKIMLKRWSLNPLWMWRYRQYKRRKAPLENTRNLCGHFDNIIVSDESKPQDMAKVVNKQGYPKNKLCLFQDHEFFKWRFKNHIHNYLFYYYMKDNVVNGYVVVSISSKNNQQAEIVDYSQSCDDAVKKILKYIIKTEHFVELLIFNYGITQELAPVFSELGFAEHWPIRKYVPKKNQDEETVLPILVRPINQVFSEQDFNIGGLNTQDFNNWRLKPICADSA